MRRASATGSFTCLMKASAKNNQTAWRPQRAAGVILVCVIVYALFGFLVLPWLADRIVTNTVRESLGAELRIGNIDFNPFTFAVVVEDIEFDHPAGDRFAIIDTIQANFEPTAMLGGTLLLAEGRVTRPRLFLQLDPQGVLNVTTIKPLDPAEEPAGEPGSWHFAIEQLEVEGMSVRLTDSTVIPAAELGIDDLSISVQQFSTAPESRSSVDLSMRLMTGGDISADGEIALFPEADVEFGVTVNGASLENVHGHIKALADVNFDSGSLSFDGKFRSNAAESFALEGDARLDDLLLTESENGDRLGSWERLAVNGIELSLTRQSLVVSEVVIDQPYADILIAANGSINLRRAGKGAEVAGETTDEVSAGDEETENVPSEITGESEPAFDVTVGRILVNDAAASFEDRALPIPFSAKITELSGQLSTIATTSDAPSEVEFEGRVDEFGQVFISGHLTPLAPMDDTNISVNFTNVEIPKFSAYTIQFAGREIAGDKLDLKLGYEIRDSQLVGENNIVLREFELGDEVPHPDATSLPLDLAVALLKDSSGHINVDLPIRGDIDDPEFGIASVVGAAFGNLIKGVAAAPFKFLSNLLGVEANELEAMHFPPGRDDLSPPQQEIAAKLGEALVMRPELVLELVGAYHVDADSLALRAAAVDERIEAAIGDTTPYAERRIAVIESLFQEATGEALPVDEADPIARAAGLRDRLVESEPLADVALNELADARANNARNAILSVAPVLDARVSVGISERTRSLDDDSVRMEVRLAPRR